MAVRRGNGYTIGDRTAFSIIPFHSWLLPRLRIIIKNGNAMFRRGFTTCQVALIHKKDKISNAERAMIPQDNDIMYDLLWLIQMAINLNFGIQLASELSWSLLSQFNANVPTQKQEYISITDSVGHSRSYYGNRLHPRMNWSGENDKDGKRPRSARVKWPLAACRFSNQMLSQKGPASPINVTSAKWRRNKRHSRSHPGLWIARAARKRQIIRSQSCGSMTVFTHGAICIAIHFWRLGIFLSDTKRHFISISCRAKDARVPD